MNRLAFRLAFHVILALFGLPAQAALIAICSATGGALAFPAYDLSRPAPTDSQSSVGLSCIAVGGVPGTLPYQLSLSRSTTNASFSRQLAFGAQRLNYNLFADASRLQIWGDGTGGTTKVSGSLSFTVLGLGIVGSHQVYARMPAGQAVRGGNYSDRVTLTVDF